MQRKHHGGGSPVDYKKRARIRQMIAAGTEWKVIVAELHTSFGTISKALKEVGVP